MKRPDLTERMHGFGAELHNQARRISDLSIAQSDADGIEVSLDTLRAFVDGLIESVDEADPDSAAGVEEETNP